MDREEILRERFQEIYDMKPEEMFDHEVSTRDLEIAVKRDSDKLVDIALVVQAEQAVEDIDEEQLSKRSKEDIRSMKAKLRFNKKVECAKYGKSWSEIRDLFVAGMHNELRESYSEEWSFEDLEKYET